MNTTELLPRERISLISSKIISTNVYDDLKHNHLIRKTPTHFFNVADSISDSDIKVIYAVNKRTLLVDDHVKVSKTDYYINGDQYYLNLFSRFE